eukprot:4475160-Alexandrium_andersonii.AAC.1
MASSRPWSSVPSGLRPSNLLLDLAVGPFRVRFAKSAGPGVGPQMGLPAGLLALRWAGRAA